MKDKKEDRKHLINKAAGITVFAILMTFMVYTFYSGKQSSFPNNIHAWAQADRYALALNFQKNGFDLFHPQTYNLDPQFPAKDTIIERKGITQVDCPIHELIIATVMTALNNNGPVVFRWYNLLYGILGFFFLFLAVRTHSRSGLKSLFVVLFAMMSPVLIYYLNGFLPSISSLASTLIAYYFYFAYRKNGAMKMLLAAVGFMTIAALSRTPFALFLGAMFCQIFYDMLRNRKLIIKTLLPFLASFGILLAYFIYNRMMAKTYGSVFLTHIMPTTDKGELYEILKHIYLVWLKSYFTIYHYILLFLLGVLFLVQWIRRKTLTEFQKTVGFQFVITAVGALAYFGLMIAQYYSHDYYFIDSFYIPVLLFVILCIDSLKLNKLSFKIGFAAVIILFAYLGYGKCKTDNMVRNTIDPNNRVFCEVNSFKGADTYLDSLGISRDATMLVIDAYSANIPFILMDRKGYVVMGTDENNIKKYLAKPVDYIAMQNEFMLAEVVNYYPDIIHELEAVGTNGKISVYRKKYKEKSLSEFLQIHDEVLFCKTSCADSLNVCAQNFAGKISCDSTLRMIADSLYFTLLEKDISQYKSRKLNLIISAECKLNLFNKANTDLIAAIKCNGEQTYYKSFALNHYFGNQAGTEFLKLSFMYMLHYKDCKDVALSLYLWNNGRNELEIRNAGIWILDAAK